MNYEKACHDVEMINADEKQRACRLHERMLEAKTIELKEALTHSEDSVAEAVTKNQTLEMSLQSTLEELGKARREISLNLRENKALKVGAIVYDGSSLILLTCSGRNGIPPEPDCRLDKASDREFEVSS